MDYYFRPPGPPKPDTELETDEEKEELSEWDQAVPPPAPHLPLEAELMGPSHLSPCRETQKGGQQPQRGDG